MGFLTTFICVTVLPITLDMAGICIDYETKFWPEYDVLAIPREPEFLLAT